MVDSDEFDSIGDLNAALNPLVETESLSGTLQDVLPAVDTCITELAVSLASAQKLVSEDSQTKEFILNALSTPFNELGNALSTLLVPDASEFESAEGFADYVKIFSEQMVESAKSPIAAMLASQASIFNQSVEELGDIFFAGGTLEEAPGQRGVISEVYDRTRYLMRELFLNPQQEGSNVAGLVVYALDEALPAIDAELRYLGRMKRSVFTAIEEASQLPPSMVPQIPNLVVSNMICDAEANLDRVIADLRNRQRWNRSEFATATAKICDAKEAIFSGIIPDDLRNQLKQIFGWDDRQINALKSFKFMPNANYRLKTIELVALNNFLQDQDAHVITFHRNLQNALSTLESIFTVGVGDALSLIIQVIKRQIKILRADLEAQGVGFTGVLFSDFPDSANEEDRQTRTARNDPRTGTGLGASIGVEVPSSIEGSIRDNKKYATDVYAHMSAQATAYATLTSLCFLMQRVEKIQDVFTSLLNANNRFMNLVSGFFDYYKAWDCGEDTGAEHIDSAVQSFLGATEARLRGDTSSNSFLSRRGRDLLQAIEQHEEFLICMRDRLFLGNDKILGAVNTATQVAEAAQNITRLVKVAPTAAEALRTLDFRRLILGEDIEFNVLDSVMRAFQCLVLQCDNQFIDSTARSASRQFEPHINKRYSRSINMGYLDELPRASFRTGQNARQQAFFRLVRSIQRLTSFDINELCEIDTEGKPSNTSAAPPQIADEEEEEVLDDSAAREAADLARLRELARQQAPYGESPSAGTSS